MRKCLIPTELVHQERDCGFSMSTGKEVTHIGLPSKHQHRATQLAELVTKPMPSKAMH